MIGVTGANGYLGGVLVAALERAGHRVRRLTRTPDAARGDAPFSLNAPVAEASVAGLDTLIHAAYDFRPPREDELRRLNVDGTRRLFDAARAAGVKRLLFISSIACWEGSRSAYGRAKWTVEQDMTASGGTSLRPGTIFSREKGGLFGSLDRVVRSAPLLPDFGPRTRLFMAHADDVAAVVLAWLALEGRPAPPPLLRAMHPTPFTMRGVLEVIAHAAGRPARFVSIPPGLALAGLKMVEATGVTLPFRSDSLVSMLNGNPSPGAELEVLGVRMRPFEPATVTT